MDQLTLGLSPKAQGRNLDRLHPVWGGGRDDPMQSHSPDSDPSQRTVPVWVAVLGVLLLGGLLTWPLAPGLLEPLSGSMRVPHSLEDRAGEAWSRAAWELDSARRSWLGEGRLFAPSGVQPYAAPGTLEREHRILHSALALLLSPFGSASWRALLLGFLGIGLSGWATVHALRALGASPWPSRLGGVLFAGAPWFLARLDQGPQAWAQPLLPLAIWALAKRSEELSVGNTGPCLRRGAQLGIALGLAALWSWEALALVASGALVFGVSLAINRRFEPAERRSPIRNHAPWVTWPVATALGGLLALPLVAAFSTQHEPEGSSTWARVESLDLPVSQVEAESSSSDAKSAHSGLAELPPSIEMPRMSAPFRPARLQPLVRSAAEVGVGAFSGFRPRRELALGWGLLALGLWGMRRRLPRTFGVAGIGLGAGLLLLGDTRILFSFEAIELWPVVQFSLLASGALGLSAWGTCTRIDRWALGSACALALFEYTPAPLPALGGSLPVYADALAELPGEGAVMQLPWTSQPASALLAQSEHGRPLICAPLCEPQDRASLPILGLERIIDRYPSFATLLSGQAFGTPSDLEVDFAAAGIEVVTARRKWIEARPEVWDLLDAIDGWATAESPQWVLWYRAPAGFELRAFVRDEAAAASTGRAG